jgi:hypothetical protein
VWLQASVTSLDCDDIGDAVEDKLVEELLRFLILDD